MYVDRTPPHSLLSAKSTLSTGFETERGAAVLLQPCCWHTEVHVSRVVLLYTAPPGASKTKPSSGHRGIHIVGIPASAVFVPRFGSSWFPAFLLSSLHNAKPIVSGHWREDRPPRRLEGRALLQGRWGGASAVCEFYTLVRGIRAPHRRDAFSPLRAAAAAPLQRTQSLEPWRSARMCG